MAKRRGARSKPAAGARPHPSTAACSPSAPNARSDGSLATSRNIVLTWFIETGVPPRGGSDRPTLRCSAQSEPSVRRSSSTHSRMERLVTIADTCSGRVYAFAPKSGFLGGGGGGPRVRRAISQDAAKRQQKQSQSPRSVSLDSEPRHRCSGSRGAQMDATPFHKTGHGADRAAEAVVATIRSNSALR
jgi:hypothetical protein